MPQQFAAAVDALGSTQVNELDRPQCHGHFDGNGVGIEAKGLAFAVAAQRRDHRNDIALQQGVEQFGVHALDSAGELVVDAVQDAGRMGDQGIAVSRAEVGRRQPFEDFMRHPVGGVERQFQGGRVGDAGAVGIGRLLAGLGGEQADLMAGPMHQGDLDPQAAQQGNVQQEVGEIVVVHHGAVQGDDEDPVAEARHVTQDFAQIGQA